MHTPVSLGDGKCQNSFDDDNDELPKKNEPRVPCLVVTRPDNHKAVVEEKILVVLTE